MSSFLEKVVKGFKNPLHAMLVLLPDRFWNQLDDKTFLRIKYQSRTRKKLNLNNPTRFNEKLQWLKLYDRKPEYTVMVDKYAVREYIAQAVGQQYLIPLIGVWDNADEIDFDALPNQFVLKCNHNSARGLCICKDKSKLDIEKTRNSLRQGLAQDFYIIFREWPYKNVKRRIIAEQYMDDGSGELRDYKVLCFNGEPKLVQYHQGRFTYHTQDFYDTQWNRLPITQGTPLSENALEKPVFLEEMLELSRKLAKDIPHVRVDWYYVDGQLYFGELTFFDASGFDDFEPDEWNEIIGSWITLPIKREEL